MIPPLTNREILDWLNGEPIPLLAECDPLPARRDSGRPQQGFIGKLVVLTADGEFYDVGLDCDPDNCRVYIPGRYALRGDTS